MSAFLSSTPLSNDVTKVEVEPGPRFGPRYTDRPAGLLSLSLRGPPANGYPELSNTLLTNS